MAIDKIEVSEDQKKFELEPDRYLGEWIQVTIDKMNEIIDWINSQ
tara:strand:+ start:627 stop:761 length:135 start_codon:yes stop_codon:yes gene_type:complete